MRPYKLGTVDIAGAATPAAMIDGRVYLLPDLLGSEAPTSIFALLQDWVRWSGQLGQLSAVSERGLDPGTLSYRSPVESPRKIICIGINYRDHLAEMKSGEPPAFPYSFLRPATCLAGHREKVRLPDGSKMVDWEAELGVIVGRRFNSGNPKEAMAAVAGYTIVNDVSARDWIASRPPVVGVDWVMQKAWNQFQPTGPWITPAEFVSDPQSLAIELTVNGTVKQRSNTSQMVFGVAEIMCHLGKIMTLEPGDIIATGTPAGVGFGRKPPEFIHSGDTVRVMVEGLGTLENAFV